MTATTTRATAASANYVKCRQPRAGVTIAQENVAPTQASHCRLQPVQHHRRRQRYPDLLPVRQHAGRKRRPFRGRWHRRWRTRRVLAISAANWRKHPLLPGRPGSPMLWACRPMTAMRCRQHELQPIPRQLAQPRAGRDHRVGQRGGNPRPVVTASSLFSITDADNDTLTYYLYDSTPGGGHFVVDGSPVAD